MATNDGKDKDAAKNQLNFFIKEARWKRVHKRRHMVRVNFPKGVPFTGCRLKWVNFLKNATSQNRSKIITASVCLGLSGCPLSRAEFLCTCAQQLGRLIPNLDRAPAQPYIYLAIHIYMDSLTLCDLSTNEFIAGNIVATEEH